MKVLLLNIPLNLFVSGFAKVNIFIIPAKGYENILLNVIFLIKKLFIWIFLIYFATRNKICN